MVQVILANVGTVICFRTGNPADERLLLPLFSPYISEGEISNQAPYNFYARFASTKAQEPLSGITLLLDGEGSEDTADEVRQVSRKLYGNDPIPVDSSKQVAEAKKLQKSKPKKTTVSHTAPTYNPEDNRQ